MRLNHIIVSASLLLPMASISIAGGIEADKQPGEPASTTETRPANSQPGLKIFIDPEVTAIAVGSPQPRE